MRFAAPSHDGDELVSIDWTSDQQHSGDEKVSPPAGVDRPNHWPACWPTASARASSLTPTSAWLSLVDQGPIGQRGHAPKWCVRSSGAPARLGRYWDRLTADDRSQPDTAGLHQGTESALNALSEAFSVRCGRCWVRTNVGDADGFTDRSLWPLGQPAVLPDRSSSG